MNARPLAVAALVLLAPLAARAEPGAPKTPRDRPSGLFQEAKDAFQRGDYAAAASAFEQAARIMPHPAAWLNASEAWERDGALERAAEDCDRALAMPGINDVYRRTADDRLARGTPKIGTLDVKSARTLEAHVDGGAEVEVPRKLRVTPGKHSLRLVDLPGATPRTVDVTVTAGETKTIDVSPPEPASKAAPRPDPDPKRDAIGAPRSEPHRGGPPLVSWVAFGVAGAGLLTAGVAGAVTLSARDDFTSDPTIAARDAFYRDRTIANVGWIVAGVAATAGVVLWLVSPSGASGDAPSNAASRLTRSALTF